MPCRRPLSLLLSFTFFVLLLSHSASASILAIDYGTEFIKASLIKPGVPFDVLLNRDSKRKIQSSVAWKGDDRLFGADAFNIATRFPSDSFTYLKSLLGVPFESESVEFYKSVSAASLVPTSRDTVAVRRPNANGTEWSVEELVGMQLAYIKELAESVGDAKAREPVKDAVVAVPPFFTQFERDALVDALELAGLNLVALVHDGTAVALNYAMARTFPETPEWHVIFDASASGVRASVVSFASVPVDAKSKSTSTHITVAGVGFDRGSGGLELDRRMRDLLANAFESTHGRSIRDDARGMAKLLKEAGRVKAVLSANNEARASIESVAFDIDFRTTITRSDFEAACTDLRPRFAQPVLDALAQAGLGLENVTSVILTGGHSRVPMVQAALKAAVGEDKIATSVNADEAAVLGAALYGASVSRQFRTKDIKVVDIVPYDVQVSYQSEAKPVETAEGEEDVQKPLKTPKTINTLVFPAGSKVGSKKTLTFKRKDDFSVKMAYRGSVGAGLPTELLEAGISGVKEAISNLTEAGAIDPVVKATVVISESGFAGIQDAIAYGELKKDEGIAGKIKGFFGGNSESSSSTETDSSDPATSSTSVTSEEPSSSSSSSSSASPTPEKKKEVKDTVRLKLAVKPLSIPALTPSELRKSRDRLIAVDNAEAAKRRREEARNNLEAYLYKMRDLLEDDEASPFKKCSKEEERSVIQEKVEEILHWMHEEGDDAQTIDFWDKQNIIQGLERPIQHRYKEIEAFPSTLNASQFVNWKGRLFITEARQNLSMELSEGLPSKYTEEEIDAVEKILKEHETWLAEWVAKQREVKPNEDPVILTTEMKARAKTLDNAILKLERRKAPKPPKKSSSKASSSSSTSSGTATATPTPNASTSSSATAVEEESTSVTTAPKEQSTSSVHDEL